MLSVFPIFRLVVCIFYAEELKFCFKHFPFYFQIVILILKCVLMMLSATKSASDSNEELNFQYPGPPLKLFMFMLILTLTSLWSECGKPSVLIFMILVRDVVSQKM